MKKFLPLVLLSFFINHAQTLDIVPHANWMEYVVDIASAGDSRLFAVSKFGNIRVINGDGSVTGVPFLTLPEGTVVSDVEAGLLGLAFHPQHSENGYFYIYYVRASDGASVLSRFSVGDNPDVADPDSEELMLVIPHPAGNNAHYAGSLKFGPDGLLYVSVGDGGVWADPDNYAQDLNTVLGKILRLDVDKLFRWNSSRCDKSPVLPI